MPIQGLQFTINSSSEAHQSYQATGSFTIYNPNDGIAFVATDRTASGQSWDYKIPSQSGGKFPGPINSYLSIYYLDQSGSGAGGQLQVYADPSSINIPHFWSIGRALQSQVTSMDVVQGTQPANPPAGVTRIWSATDGSLHILNSSGTDKLIIDTSNLATYVTPIINATALGGDLTGTIANGHVSVQAGSAINFAGGGQIYPTGASVTINTLLAGNSSINGTLTVAGGTNIHSDLTVDRNSALGYVWLGNTSQHYIGYDGTQYVMPNGGLNLQGGLTASGQSQINSNLIVSGGSLYMSYGNYVLWNSTGNTAIYCDVNQMQFAHTNQWVWNKVGSTTISSTLQQFTNGGWAFVFSGYFGVSAGQAMCVAGNNLQGQAFYVNGGAGGAGGWNVIPSTLKYKREVRVIDEALALLNDTRLHGVHYTVEPPDIEAREAFGFIAEPWLECAPDIVSLDDNGELAGMDYGQITPILFEAFKQYMTQTDDRLLRIERQLDGSWVPGR